MTTQSNNSQSHTNRKRPLQKAATYLSLVMLGVGATISGDYFLSQPNRTFEAKNAQAVEGIKEASPVIAQTITPIPTNGNFVTNVVQEVGPAVVRIDASRTVSTNLPKVFNDPAFRRFFGSQIPDIPDQQIRRGMGSGVIINDNGQIITNAHVVDGADKVTVTLKDGRTFEGTVMGKDTLTDIAVIKIDAQNLPAAQLGNSDQLQPGEWAIAIGNPLGLDNTVTTGIISATGRSSAQVGVSDKRINFIQTDAAINPGNSGGPLLNQKGEVIGINTAIIQGAQGLGFAIPINAAQEIAAQLITNGRVEHAFLGVQMASITPELKREINRNPNSGLNVTEDEGILVVKVVPNSPAEKGGLRAGDVIQSIGNQSAKDAETMQKVVSATKVGKELPITLRRQGRTLNMNVKVGTLPEQSQ